MTDAVIVSLCVNDGTNGNHTGRVRAVLVDETGDLIELESPWGFQGDYSCYYPSCSIDQVGRVLKLGHCVFRIHGYRRWCGNMCWDAVSLTRRDARRLTRYLVRTRKWQVEGGPVESDLLPAEVVAP